MDLLPTELGPWLSAGLLAFLVALTWGIVEASKPIPWLDSGYYRLLACLVGMALTLLAFLATQGQLWAGIILIGLAIGALTTGGVKLAQDAATRAQDAPSDTEPPQDAPGSPLTALPVPPASLDGYTITDAKTGRELRLVAAPLPKKP